MVRILKMLLLHTAYFAAWISMRKGPLWAGGTRSRNLDTVGNIWNILVQGESYWAIRSGRRYHWPWSLSVRGGRTHTRVACVVCCGRNVCWGGCTWWDWWWMPRRISTQILGCCCSLILVSTILGRSWRSWRLPPGVPAPPIPGLSWWWWHPDWWIWPGTGWCRLAALPTRQR